MFLGKKSMGAAADRSRRGRGWRFVSIKSIGKGYAAISDSAVAMNPGEKFELREVWASVGNRLPVALAADLSTFPDMEKRKLMTGKSRPVAACAFL